MTTFITELEGLNSIAVVGNEENIWISRKASDMNCFDSEGRLTKKYIQAREKYQMISQSLKMEIFSILTGSHRP